MNEKYNQQPDTQPTPASTPEQSANLESEKTSTPPPDPAPAAQMEQPSKPQLSPENTPESAPPPPSSPSYEEILAAKKKKTDAINTLGDKIAEFMKTNIVLEMFEKRSDIVSYIVTGICFFFTVLAMLLGSSSFVFGFVALIFGFFSLSKKTTVPLSIALSTLSLFSFVRFIRSIAGIVRYEKYFLFPAEFTLTFFFSLFEMALIGFLTYLSWNYFAAALPPKPQNHYEQQKQQQKQPQSQQYAQPPVLTPLEKNAGAKRKYCMKCGTENNGDATFCKHCGNRFLS